jgi:hypothetical protein
MLVLFIDSAMVLFSRYSFGALCGVTNISREEMTQPDIQETQEGVWRTLCIESVVSAVSSECQAVLRSHSRPSQDLKGAIYVPANWRAPFFRQIGSAPF